MTETILAIGPIGSTEMLLIGAVIILLFGATKLPQLAKALGQSKKAFREGLDEGEREARKEAPENKTTTTTT
ncbi:MAG TPA: twin-arginine translocase TatA/TatE family subunit [Pyrinomonadaceae bacterium]|nr:twin-arginine translocase TatA/TatE family subunit [Pyrinomonadaceae bacterium]